MSNPYDPSITEDFGDGTHTFRLGVDQIYELEEKCGCGVFAIPIRLTRGEAYYNYVREAIRLGLTGGGMKPIDALKFVRRYVDEGNKTEAFDLALRLLHITLDPPADIKKNGEAAEKPAPQTSDSAD